MNNPRYSSISAKSVYETTEVCTKNSHTRGAPKIASALHKRTRPRARSSQQMRLRTKLTKGNLRDKQWWQAVKRVGGVSKGSEIPMIIDSSGREHVNAKEKADVFAKHFSDKIKALFT